jgi:hypothetical protein
MSPVLLDSLEPRIVLFERRKGYRGKARQPELREDLVRALVHAERAQVRPRFDTLKRRVQSQATSQVRAVEQCAEVGFHFDRGE